MELRSPSVWNNESSLFVFIMKHLFELLSSCSHIKKKTKTTKKTPKLTKTTSYLAHSSWQRILSSIELILLIFRQLHLLRSRHGTYHSSIPDSVCPPRTRSPKRRSTLSCYSYVHLCWLSKYKESKPKLQKPRHYCGENCTCTIEDVKKKRGKKPPRFSEALGLIKF